MKFTEKSYINGVSSLCYTLINLTLAIAYVIEWIKGARTLGYALVILAFSVLPTVTVWIAYKRNRNTRIIQHVMGVCYSAVYLFCIFTTHSETTFIYAFPMYTVATLFCDVVYCAVIAVGGFLGNVIAVFVLNNNGVAITTTDLTIRMAAMVLVGAFMVLVCAGMRRITKYRLAEVNDQKEKARIRLENTLTISGKISERISEANGKMEHLADSVNQMQNSMKEVNDGNTETADSVQQQLLRTEEIQKYISDVRISVDGIDEDMKHANTSVQNGLEYVTEMAAQVQQSKEANDTVIQKMAELTEYTENMNSIIEMINSITGKTGLLALNASIEAARAGEAGKGFAVVAGEISSLANQTKDATIHITELIDSINHELAAVSAAISQVTACNDSHAISAKAVEKSFDEIAGEVSGISDKVSEMGTVVENLGVANDFIVESIQTISAISEEVSAHSNETYNTCEDNSIMVKEVSTIMNELNEQAQELTAQEES